MQTAPSPRMYHSLVYVQKLDKVFLFGGQSYHHWGMDLQDVWAFNLSGTNWEYLGTLPSGEAYAAAYDEKADQVIILNLNNETWAFSPESVKWELLNVPFSPEVGCGHKMVYDTVSGKIVLFGGFRCKDIDDQLFNQTWVFDAKKNLWVEMKPEINPPARIYHGMAYNSAADKTIVWGGRPFEEKSDTRLWIYDLHSNTWNFRDPPSGPASRYVYPALAYNPIDDLMIMFGGLELSSDFSGRIHSETWVYDFEKNEWHQIKCAHQPESRSHHAAVFIDKDEKFFLFGGEIISAYSNEVANDAWFFDLKNNHWEIIEPHFS